MNLSKDDYEFLYKKLEYTFKHSNNSLVSKILNKEDLSNDDLKLLAKKLEYKFKKSGHEILKRIQNSII